MIRKLTRLSSSNRRAVLLESATEQFTRTGMHGTTTAALAKASGVSEPLLYAHFDDKEHLFREAVKDNIRERLRGLETSLSAMACATRPDCIAGAAEATILGCVSPAANAILTNWALLEDPEYARSLYRDEVEAVVVLWDKEFTRRLADVPAYTRSAVHASLAYGFWLAALRHTPESAAGLARQFADRLAKATQVSDSVVETG